MPHTTNTPPTGFVDRRDPYAPVVNPGVERRQFGNNHDSLSPAARELATTIESYKVRHRRRFITYEEMLDIFLGLGYFKPTNTEAYGEVASAR